MLITNENFRTVIKKTRSFLRTEAGGGDRNRKVVPMMRLFAGNGILVEQAYLP